MEVDECAIEIDACIGMQSAYHVETCADWTCGGHDKRNMVAMQCVNSVNRVVRQCALFEGLAVMEQCAVQIGDNEWFRQVHSPVRGSYAVV